MNIKNRIAFALTAVVTMSVTLLAAMGQTPASPPTSAPATPKPVDVFAELDGTWKGVFVGYDTSGVEQYRIDVEQHYETVDANTQRVTVTDRMSDGTVIRGEGENTAIRVADGRLQLKCVVRKSNGDRVVHDGRIVRGPDGDEQLVWYSRARDRAETFRESVRHEGTRVVYEINGTGTYGGTTMLMTGRYYKEGTKARRH